MRAEIAEVAERGTASGRPEEPIVTVVRRSRRIDRFDLGVLVAFASVSLWVLGLDLWQVIAHGRVWTGTDGVYIVDQMQYLAWIREAAHHGLVSNLFVLHSTPADYFQPAVLISGGLSALGMAPWLSLLLWKPVAVGAAFWAVRAYVRRSVTGLWQRRAALVLALFFGSFTVLHGSVTVLGDLFPGFLSWGYEFALIGLAAMVGALVSYDRAWLERRVRWLPGLLGAVASCLHPWNGEMLIAVVVGSELIMRLHPPPGPRRLALPAITVLATAAPLGYYALLGQLDPSWQLAREASKHTFPLWPIALVIAPLLVPALAAYRGRPQTLLAAATRFWPLATLVIYVLSATGASATPLHAFQGITVPLALLAVQGAQRLGWRRVPRRRLLAALAVAVATIPATVVELNGARKLSAPTAENANFITHDEQRAVRYLAAEPTAGGVITRSYLGALIPGFTGRHTLIGDCLWSEPGCLVRTAQAQALFDGSIPPNAARTFVLQSHARFVLADCETTINLTTVLAPITTAVHSFGCATVYEVG